MSHTRSSTLLPPSPSRSGDFASVLLEPSFVGGEVICSSVFTTLVAQVYFKPLLSSFIDWVTNTGQNAGVCVRAFVVVAGGRSFAARR